MESFTGGTGEAAGKKHNGDSDSRSAGAPVGCRSVSQGAGERSLLQLQPGFAVKPGVAGVGKVALHHLAHFGDQLPPRRRLFRAARRPLQQDPVAARSW